MPDSSLIAILTGSGVAGVFCILFILGYIFPRTVVTDLKAENAELKEALEAERDRANTAVAAQRATTDIVAALQVGLEMARHERRSE
jgi:hypothetical protein